MKEPNFSFSPDDFKQWIKENEKHETKKQKQNNLIGLMVESKISSKRLMANIKSKDGDPFELSHDFKENGGFIYDVEGRNFLIEVSSGFFYIPRFLVKKTQEQKD